MRCMKGMWVRGIPIFEKKHFSPQSNDILERTLKVVEGDDSQDSCSKKYEPFFSKENRSGNISDPNERCGQ